MPGANIIAIVTLFWVTSHSSKIMKVTRSTIIGNVTTSTGTVGIGRGNVLVISNHRMGNRFEAAPTYIVGLQECLIASTKILEISKWEDSFQTRIHQEIRGIFLMTSSRTTISIVKNRIGRITRYIACGCNHGIRSSQRHIRMTSQLATTRQKQNR